MALHVKIGDLQFDVEVGDINDRPVRVTIGDDVFEVWPEEPDAGGTAPARVEPVRPAQPAVSGSAIGTPGAVTPGATTPGVTAPMPGVIIAVTAHPGDLVKAGDELVVLEAMKMKNPIRAIRPGTVCAILVNPGDHVKKGQSLVEFVG